MTTEANKETLNQKLARKNAWLTKLAFVAIGLAVVITLARGHF
ncbi:MULTISPECIES: hypothetical protein [Burkholderiaceae]|jgi:hypothetical protein|nr:MULTISPECIES: hypothetical protein [Burkholderiaceae]